MLGVKEKGGDMNEKELYAKLEENNLYIYDGYKSKQIENKQELQTWLKRIDKVLEVRDNRYIATKEELLTLREKGKISSAIFDFLMFQIEVGQKILHEFVADLDGKKVACFFYTKEKR